MFFLKELFFALVYMYSVCTSHVQCDTWYFNSGKNLEMELFQQYMLQWYFCKEFSAAKVSRPMVTFHPMWAIPYIICEHVALVVVKWDCLKGNNFERGRSFVLVLKFCNFNFWKAHHMLEGWLPKWTCRGLCIHCVCKYASKLWYSAGKSH